MRAYSEDLRRRKVIEAAERGISKSHTAHLFGISLSCVKRYARMARQGRPLSPKKGTGRPPKIDERATKLFEEDVKSVRQPPSQAGAAASWSTSRTSL